MTVDREQHLRHSDQSDVTRGRRLIAMSVVGMLTAAAGIEAPGSAECILLVGGTISCLVFLSLGIVSLGSL